MTAPSYRVFRDFLRVRSADLRSISKLTRGEQTPEDIGQSAWLIADEIAKRRGNTIDFADPSDQELVLRWLNSKFVGFGERKIRNAFKLDRDRDPSENGAAAYSTWAVAPAASDPLFALVEREEKLERWDIPKRFGYSQAAVYAFLLVRFGRKREAAASLAIAIGTFNSRMESAVQHVKVQPSLFDRTERLDPEFIPKPGQPRTILKRPETTTRRQLSIRLNRMSQLRFFWLSLYSKLLALAGSRRLHFDSLFGR